MAKNKKSLVLVVGAGASYEAGLPLGTELTGSIAKALDIRFQPGSHTLQSGERTIAAAYEYYLYERDSTRNPNIHALIEAGLRIREAMPLAPSIDNFLDSQRDENVTICGKLAIAHCILMAERNSPTLYRKDPFPVGFPNFPDLRNTWFAGFFKKLCENCRWEDLPERLENLAIITFNYDRCIEHFLYHALSTYYKRPAEEIDAAKVLKHLRIFHPYGSVGRLSWQIPDNPVESSFSVAFGADLQLGEKLYQVAKGIATFTEGVDPETSNIKELRQVVANADRIAFLGFAFHRLNMELLFPGPTDGEPQRKTSVFGTAVGISASDCEAIRDILCNQGLIDPSRIVLRSDLKCNRLFEEYGITLSITNPPKSA